MCSCLQRLEARIGSPKQHATRKASFIKTYADCKSTASSITFESHSRQTKLNQVPPYLYRVYSAFLHTDKSNLKIQRTHSQHYHMITEIRGQR